MVFHSSVQMSFVGALACSFDPRSIINLILVLDICQFRFVQSKGAPRVTAFIAVFVD